MTIEYFLVCLRPSEATENRSASQLAVSNGYDLEKNTQNLDPKRSIINHT